MVTDCPTDSRRSPEHGRQTCGYDARAHQPQGKDALAPPPHNLPVVLQSTALSVLSSEAHPSHSLTMPSPVRQTGQASSHHQETQVKERVLLTPGAHTQKTKAHKAMESNESQVKLSIGLGFSSN